MPVNRNRLIGDARLPQTSQFFSYTSDKNCAIVLVGIKQFYALKKNCSVHKTKKKDLMLRLILSDFGTLVGGGGGGGVDVGGGWIPSQKLNKKSQILKLLTIYA